MKKESLVRIAMIVGVAAVCGGGYAYAANRPQAYQTATIEKGNIAGKIEESGNLSGEIEKIYYAKISAPVQSFSIKEGDSIKKGDLLLSYDVSDLEYSVKEASLTREQSEKDYDGQVAKSNQYAAQYAKAQADDVAYAGLYAMHREQQQALEEGQYAQDYQIQCSVDGVNRRIAEKKSVLQDKTQELGEIQDLESKKAKELQEEIDDLNDDLAGLNKELVSAPPQGYTPDEYAVANDTGNVMEDIVRNWEQAKSDKATAESGILNASQKSALHKTTEISLEREAQATEELKKAQEGVVAEFNGVVTSCSVKEDAFVTEGTPLFTVESNDDVKVGVMVSKYEIGRVKKEQSAQIDIAGKKYEGTVERIGQVAVSDDSDKSKVLVEVHMNDVDEGVILGMEADVTIYTETAENVLLLPYEAYYTDDEGSYCYLISKGVIEKCYFEAGIVSDDYVEIKDGIAEDSVVITDAMTDKKIGERASEATH